MFATVGFGDITAKTEVARLVVTVQMMIDLVILGLGGQGHSGRGHARPAAADRLVLSQMALSRVLGRWR